MRILIAASPQYIAYHGQAIFTMNLAEGLVKNGHTVLALVASDHGKAYRSEHNGVPIQALAALDLKAFHPDAYLALFTSNSVRNAIRDFQPDIIHIQDHYPLSRNAAIWSKRLGVRVVGTNHFMPENLAAYVPVLSKIKPVFNWVLWHWMRETYDRLDTVVGPSRIAVDILRSVGLRPPVRPISCGVNTSLFRSDPAIDRLAWRARYGIDPNKIVFFFVGRVDKEKHLEVLLQAVRLLERDDLQVVIAGKGAESGNLTRLAKQLGLGDKVCFTGFLPQPDLPAVLNSIDIFAMPSQAELLSISTLQAMGCARPILAADAVALPELVTDHVNGLLFKPGEVADAARGMTWLADHKEAWAGMGVASLKKVQAHSLENIVHLYEELYFKVLEGTPVDRAA
jgi:1,2-diacylglycerol 3-alpha-glucosyltransferase